MYQPPTENQFSLGMLLITPGAKKALHPHDCEDALCRHARGDWGNVYDVERVENERALERDDRIFSVYCGSEGTEFWIVTEGDRSTTTILLPEDY